MKVDICPKCDTPCKFKMGKKWCDDCAGGYYADKHHELRCTSLQSLCKYAINRLGNDPKLLSKALRRLEELMESQT